MRGTRWTAPVAATATIAFAFAACRSSADIPEEAAPAVAPVAADVLPQGGGSAVVIAAAGDIGDDGGPSTANEQTADIIVDLAPDAVLTLGDNQYDNGELAEYQGSYDLTWGGFRDITFPTPGNHDYHTQDAQGYFDYFGDVANPPDGFYSFDLGSWHLVAVNSEDGSISDEQLAWIRRDLRRDDHRCELAYWHHPRWSSGSGHGSDADMAAIWRLMVRQGVDVVLNGHDHVYERFAKLDRSGERDRQGTREFIVGTGGQSLYGFDSPENGSQVRIAEYGIITMVLKERRYEWAFLLADDGSVRDDGGTRCHP
jgi:hypothetical protein